MNFKKFISGVSAFAIAASAFAGMAVTANAADTIYSRASVSDWSDADKEDWTVSGATTTSIDATNGLYMAGGNGEMSASKAITVTENAKLTVDAVWNTGSSTGNAGNYNYFKLGDNIELRAWGQAQKATMCIDNVETNLPDFGIADVRGDKAWTIHMEIDTAMSTITSLTINSEGGASYTNPADIALASASFSSIGTGFHKGGRTNSQYNSIKSLVITEEKQTVTSVGYTINYIYGDNTINTFASKGVVDQTVNAESPITVDGTKYYAANGSSTSMTLSADETNNVLNVTLRAAETYTTSLISSVDGSNISTDEVVEGNSVALPYPRYQLYNGVFYSAAATNSEYRKTLTPDSDDYTQTITYTASEKENVVFYSEGENVNGAVKTSAGNNMTARSSNAACGYASEDVTIVNLPAGMYKVTGMVYANSSAGVTLNFALGGTEFSFEQKGATNGSEYTSEEITLTSAADLVFKTSGTSKDALDYIYVVKTGDITPDPTVEAGEATNVVTYSGDEYDGEATSASVVVSYANMLAGNVITLTYNGTTKDVNGATNISGNGNITVGVVIQNIADANPVFTAGVIGVK